MLWTICVALSVLWLLGLLSGYTMGHSIHVLLVIAIIILVVRESFRDEKYCSDFGPGRAKVRHSKRRMVNRSVIVLPKLAILSGEKVSQPIISPKTFQEG